MLRLIVRRRRLSGTRSTVPNSAKSGNSTGPMRGTAAPGAVRGISRAARFTSPSEMRPPGPVPCTARMSTPISRARRRTEGEANTGRASGSPSTSGGGLAASGAGSAPTAGSAGASGSAAAATGSVSSTGSSAISAGGGASASVSS